MARVIGERVGAILGADEGVVRFLGYGVYAGLFVPYTAAGFMGTPGRTVATLRICSGWVCRSSSPKRSPRICVPNGPLRLMLP